MILKVSLVIVLFTITIYAFSQNIQTPLDFEMYGSHGEIPSSKNSEYEMTYSDIEGTPYLNDEFTEGDVYLKNETKYEGIKLRYNIYSDNIEFKNSKGNVLNISDPDSYESFVFDDHTFVYRTYFSNKTEISGYLQVLVSGNFVLYKRWRVRYSDAVKAGAYEEAKPARFNKNTPDYLISTGDDKIEILNAKEIEKELTELYPELKEIIKTENLNIKQETDLVKLVEFCNSLNSKQEP